MAAGHALCYADGMKAIAFCVYREDEYFVAQCLKVDVSSFETTSAEAIANLKEAVELYFEAIRIAPSHP